MATDRLAYRVPEAAEVLGVSVGFIHKLRERGYLKVTHIGRAVRITRTELERLLEVGVPHLPTPIGSAGGSMHGHGGGFSAPLGGSDPAALEAATG